MSTHRYGSVILRDRGLIRAEKFGCQETRGGGGGNRGLWRIQKGQKCRACWSNGTNLKCTKYVSFLKFDWIYKLCTREIDECIQIHSNSSSKHLRASMNFYGPNANMKGCHYHDMLKWRSREWLNGFNESSFLHRLCHRVGLCAGQLSHN